MITAQSVYQWLADLVVLFHVAFVLFAIFGGLLAMRWQRLVWMHLITVAWAAIVEFFGWICPLTPLENWLRENAGAPAYRSDFIAHYVLPVLYPEGLTRKAQVALAILVILVNLAIYSWLLRRKSKAQKIES